MSGGGVHFDAKGLNTMAQPVMVQWQNNELVSVWRRRAGQGPCHFGRVNPAFLCTKNRRIAMQFLQALVDGVLLGGVYAVISIGLTLVFGVVSIVNSPRLNF